MWNLYDIHTEKKGRKLRKNKNLNQLKFGFEEMKTKIGKKNSLLYSIGSGVQTNSV